MRIFILLCCLLVWHAAHAQEPESVLLEGYAPGTVVVRTNERHLYYVTSENQALLFPIGVGRTGLTWQGKTTIAAKYKKPAWTVPRSLAHDKRYKQNVVVPGGSPSNPMGAAALVLAIRNYSYAIHGTNDPKSIGGYVSAGCIRMHNEHVMELYDFVRVGTPVVVEK